MYFITLICIAITAGGAYLLCRYNTQKAVRNINQVLAKVAEGNIEKKLRVKPNDPYASIAQHTNQLIDNLRRATHFSEEIGRGNFEVDFTPNGEHDTFGSALAGMMDRLQEVAEQDKVRRWATEGLAHFAEIFRTSNEDLTALSRKIISELVQYMGVNQGGVFIFDDADPEEPVLELAACYAYSRNKYMKKRIPVGDGLIGQAYLEKATVHMTQVPQQYTEITSGLGEATPSSILIVPLKINEQVEGILEIAAFEKFKPYQIEFVEKLAESIAATIAAVKTSERTQQLLVQSQKQAERMRIQEEEVRKKNEQLEISQEEMRRQQTQLETVLRESKEQEASLTSLINNINDIVFTVDTAYNLVLFNQAFQQYYGEEATPIIHGSNVLELYPESYRIAFQNDFDQALKGERFHVQRKLIHKGNFNIFDIYYSPIRSEDGAVTGVSIFSKEVTEYIKKNEEIRRSQQEVAQQAKQLQHTKEAVNRSGVATIEFDMEGYILDANDAFLKIMKYDSIDEILGERHEIFMPPQQINSKSYKNFWNRLRNGESSSAQYERIAKNGDTVWLAGSYNVVTEVNGKAIMVIQVGFDVTETVELIYKTMHQAQQIQMAQNEAKKQMDELNAQKARKEAIVEALHEGVILFNSHGIVEYCNTATETLLHVTKENLLGQPITNALPLFVENQPDTVPTVFWEKQGEKVALAMAKPFTLPTQHNGALEITLSVQKNEQSQAAEQNFMVFLKQVMPQSVLQP